MNNRKWLETLSDEEFVEWCIKYFWTQGEAIKDTSPCVVYSVKDMAKKMLQSEHPTTADEDMAEHDYIKTEQNEFMVIYKSGKIRDDNTEVYVYPKETRILILPNKTTRFVDLEDNEIRTIVDKKRKEMGWDK